MKARIVIMPAGQVSIFVDEGTLESGKIAIEKLLGDLRTQGVEFDDVSPVEQHRHDDRHAEEHSHVHSH